MCVNLSHLGWKPHRKLNRQSNSCAETVRWAVMMRTRAWKEEAAARTWLLLVLAMDFVKIYSVMPSDYDRSERRESQAQQHQQLCERCGRELGRQAAIGMEAATVQSDEDTYLPPYSEIFKPGLPGSRTVIGVAQMTYYPRTPDFEAALLEHLPYLDEVTPDTVRKWLGLDDNQ